ncbi:NAD(P)-dependent oxidoreductase [Novosphingobium sp. G106]|uniref:NAD-dependent epimerase/dehydratase family protein n=1 Tax=Novosphingobium sp. G106 TaxID=2849500 RepID=UPI001C2CCE7C|nr:NAD(P)-dependent oxidoreductase [Novosphingobium sp. G106]MBV1690040.1 NAD(P)-dependent oxidoreductase [Novosphingobium sp. G106]
MAHPPASSRFVLTGPSGWIGRAMLDALSRAFDGRLGGRVVTFGSRARSMTLASGERLEVRALDTIGPDDVAGAHVIHLAYLTKEKADQLGESAFNATNDAIDDALLAAIGMAAPASLFVSSSGAAALAERGGDQHPYGLAKLRQEARFIAWGKSAGIPVIAGRIFNVAGPHINKLQSYAISNFALQAREQGEILIEAQVPVFRSFLHVDDLCTLVIDAAVQGVGRDRPIDLCGAEVVEMEDLAVLVAEASPNSPKINRRPVDYTRPSLYLGDHAQTKVLAMELGDRLSALPLQVRDTIAWLDRTSAMQQ